MARGETTTIVLADTSVLVNLAMVERLDLLGAPGREVPPGEAGPEAVLSDLDGELASFLGAGATCRHGG